MSRQEKFKMISSNIKLKHFSEAILICWLAMIFPFKAGNTSDYIYQNEDSQQLQQSHIHFDASDLQTSNNILRIVKVDRLGNGNFQGEVRLGGKKIRKINSNITEINLSSLLKPGKNILEISGIYTPINSSIKVDFLGANTRVTQESGGTGKVNHRLIFTIK